ncbi:trigger factor [bacterium]|jgi:trigger factor|nr:trigger factor [bacterium]MBT4335540.1 trigger factor [bacterium]MBT4495303.1 trigger factor [bacterium]MBT4763666.1 trigger factor [bacterium]MBT5401037.1 trigger factor [bacterium]
MNVEKKELDKSQIELNIEVSLDELKPFLEKGAISLSTKNKIEGFRPGKAPFDIVKQRLGEMAIYQEALDSVVSHFYFEAVKQEKIDTIGQPKIDIEKVAPGNPIIFKAQVALTPKVTLGDYKSVKVKMAKVEVDAKAIEKVIDDLKKMQAKEVISLEPIKKGDKVEVDFNVSLDKVAVDGGQGKKYPLIVGDNVMLPGFEDNLIGMNKNEEKKFQLKFPEEYQNKMVAGKLCDFEVKVLEVFKRELPEANDEWAKTVGAKDIKDLNEKIKSNLEQEKKFQEEQRVEIEILTAIVKKTEYSEIPEVLIHNETHRMLHEFEDGITKQGIPFDEYLKNIKKERKDLENEFKDKAEERVKTSLVIKEMSDKEKFTASDEELKKETDRILETVKDNKEAQDSIQSNGYQEYLRTIIKNKKVVEMLKKECIG